jgi:1,4-alpha-glucan branching enzyme
MMFPAAAISGPACQRKACRRNQVSEKKAVTFKTAADRGSRVYVAGTFNHWDATSYRLRYCASKGVFKTTLLLAPGYYEYKFVIDGLWHVDVGCPNWALNDNGTLNSVIKV